MQALKLDQLANVSKKERKVFLMFVNPQAFKNCILVSKSFVFFTRKLRHDTFMPHAPRSTRTTRSVRA